MTRSTRRRRVHLTRMLLKMRGSGPDERVHHRRSDGSSAGRHIPISPLQGGYSDHRCKSATCLVANLAGHGTREKWRLATSTQRDPPQRRIRRWMRAARRLFSRLAFSRPPHALPDSSPLVNGVALSIVRRRHSRSTSYVGEPMSADETARPAPPAPEDASPGTKLTSWDFFR